MNYLPQVGLEVSVGPLRPLTDDGHNLVPTGRLYQPVVHGHPPTADRSETAMRYTLV
jgi:hypothetical protein